jgi:hypothetical protein
MEKLAQPRMAHSDEVDRILKRLRFQTNGEARKEILQIWR